MLQLPDVTLICMETQAHELARLAMNDTAAKIQFGGVIVYSDFPDRIQVPGARYLTVPNWPNKLLAESFYYNEAAMAATTSHVLLHQWDAGVRDVNMWRDSFLEYDYIGAPWNLGAKDGLRDYTVGNGGFTLISKRMATYVFENRQRFKIVTDYGIARNNRKAIEDGCGARYAPRDVAWNFSFENPERGNRREAPPSFGYHDIFNWPLALDREEVLRRTRLVMENTYIRSTTKLHFLGNDWPWVREAVGPSLYDASARPSRYRPGSPLIAAYEQRKGVRA